MQISAAAALFCFFVALQPPPDKRRPVPEAIENSIQQAIAAYAQGDDLAVERWVTSADGVLGLPYLETVLARPGPWTRAKAAFLLEVAVALEPFRAPAVIAAGRSFMMSRPTALGADPLEDRFEVLWHHVALAVLQNHPQVLLQQVYLDAVLPRFDDARRRGIRLETRFPLARAISTAIVCCWKRGPGEIVRVFSRQARSGVTLETALTLFEAAAREEPLRAEATIRGGKLLYDAGRPADAVAWLERVPAHADRTLVYVQHLTHARVLDQLNRSADAAEAYRRALSLAPATQPARIGLAAALLRLGRPEDAARAAADARKSDDATAYFSDFHRADSRFIREWLAEIRKLR